MNNKTPADGASFDAIVIGSGMGSLATASLLAQVGKKRVLMLERHAKLGGYTHSFNRKGFEWDVGLHYVGEMQPDTMPRRVMDLVTGHAVKWHAMGDTYERIVLPGMTFEVPRGAAAFRARLQERFPDDAPALDQYFKDLQKAQGWAGVWYTSKIYPRAVGKLMTAAGSALALMNTRAYLSRFKSPVLQSILGAQWPNFGTSPDHSIFAQHAMVQGHFLEGGFTPEQGAQSLAEAAQQVIQAHGGTCLVSHPVDKILVHKGKAAGVEVVRKGQRLRWFAPAIVSGAGARTTFERLVPEGFCDAEKRQVERMRPGVSAVVLFLGLKDDPRDHGFDDANYWMYQRLDHDTELSTREGEPERVDGAFLSFCSLRRPGCTKHTAQIITFCPPDAWAPYAGSEWMNRSEDYMAHKARMTEALLSFVEARVPGVRALISHAELATPQSFEHFGGHREGWVYGPLCDVTRFTDNQWRAGTSLPRLYLTGSDVGSPGVDGALMAGMMTAAKVLGPLGLARIFARVYGKPRPVEPRRSSDLKSA